MILLGPQLYTVRDFTQTEEGIENTFRLCHENAYETVQISGFKPIPISDMTGLLKKYDIHVCCTHSPFDRIVNDTDALIEEHKAMDCPVIGLGFMPEKYWGASLAEGIKEFIRDITPAAHKIKKAGLQFAYHNHNLEFQKLDDGRLIMDYLVDDTDPDAFHFIPDTYWLQLGGVNPSDFIREKLHGRVEVCHFKDLAVVDRQAVFAEVGEGNLDLLDCFEACREIGVKAIVIEQDVCPRDPFDCLKHSYKNLVEIARQAGDRPLD